MGFFELMARWRYLRQEGQRDSSDARWHAFRQRQGDMKMRSRGEH
jgi:hypothetical protein